jgi:hypothetical protein
MDRFRYIGSAVRKTRYLVAADGRALVLTEALELFSPRPLHNQICAVHLCDCSKVLAQSLRARLTDMHGRRIVAD